MAVFKKKLSYTIRLDDDFDRNSLIEVQIQNLNLHNKRLPGEGIYIYGCYDVFLLYKRSVLRNDENDYKVRYLRRSFGTFVRTMVILGESINENTISSVSKVSFKPAARILSDNCRRHRDTISLEIYGDITLRYLSQKIVKTAEIKEGTAQEILQFEKDGKYTLKELMEMDIEKLKELYNLKK